MRQVNGVIDVRLKQITVLFKLVQRQLFQRFVCPDAGTHHGAGAFVSIAERHAFLGQVVGAVRCVDKALGGGAAHVGGQRRHGGQHRGDGF